MIDRSKLERVEVLFEDEVLLAVNKPPGLAVHGGAEQQKSLIGLLQSASPQRLQLVHRLDLGTSGALLLAKRPDIASALSLAWAQTEKRYLTIALGQAPSQVVEVPLSDKEGRKQPAKTRFTRLSALEAPAQTSDGSTLLLAELHTGRTHQIRRHLAGLAHPVLMDDRYGNFGANKRWSKGLRDMGLPRPKHLMLHAFVLCFPHPQSGASIRIQAPLPQRWQQILQSLSGAVDALEHIS